MTDRSADIEAVAVAKAIREKAAEIDARPGVHDADAMWFADEYATAAIEALRPFREAAEAKARAEAYEDAARVAIAAASKANVYYEQGLGGPVGMDRNHARYNTAQGIAAAIRAIAEPRP